MKSLIKILLHQHLMQKTYSCPILINTIFFIFNDSSYSKKSSAVSNRNEAKSVIAADRYKRAMNSDEGNKLVEDYLPLVKATVLRMRHNFPDTFLLDDMYAIGAKALVISVNQFDVSGGKSFGNYAALRIRGALLDELRRLDCLHEQTGPKLSLFRQQSKP